MAFKSHLTLRDGRQMPRLGMGTWRLGEGLHPRAQELAALRAGIDAGIRLIDSAEMYGDGATEELVRKSRNFQRLERKGLKNGEKELTLRAIALFTLTH